MNNEGRLSDIDGQHFDVFIIGAGMNGASGAQQLAAAGYSTLIVDKADFGSGSSSKSGRLITNGLRYLAPGTSIWDFARSPSKFVAASRMASQAMVARSEFVRDTPDRAKPYDCAFPVYKSSIYRRWQTEFAFRYLKILGGRDLPLEYKWHAPKDVAKVPLARWLRDRDEMLGLATYREYQFDWPERVCVDLITDAQSMGAVAKNYTAVVRMQRHREEWELELQDTRPGHGNDRAVVWAKQVLNTAGIWIDKVNALASNGAKRRIMGTKGIHIIVELPPECSGYAIHTFNRESEGYSCIPLRGMHAIGPTETLFEGNPDDIKPTNDEIDFLIAETNWIFPSMNLKRENVIFAYAGVRPLGADEAYPKGKRSREIHDLTADGMPGVHAMTAGPIMTHRSAGRELKDTVASKIQPSGSQHRPSYNRSGSNPLWQQKTSPSRISDVSEPLLAQISANEQVHTLADLMLRRLGLGWSARMGYDDARQAAERLGAVQGWSDERIRAEVDDFQRQLVENFRFKPNFVVPPVQPT